MAGTPQYKFFIYHDVSHPLGVEIPIPIGWDEAKLRLERHAEYHSLIEYFDCSFQFYGYAYEVIKALETGFGVDALIRFVIKIKFNVEWNILFDGQIDVSQNEDTWKGKFPYKCKLPVIRNDFWAKFINRKSTEVDIMSPKNLDGADVSLPVVRQLDLPPQVLNQTFDGNQGTSQLESLPGDIVVGRHIQCSFDVVVDLDELETRFPAPFATRADPPSYIFSAQLKGSYSFDVTVAYQLLTQSFTIPIVTTYTLDPIAKYIKCYIQKNNEAPIVFNGFTSTSVDVGLLPAFTISVKTNFANYTGTIELEAGDQIKIYAKVADITWGAAGSSSFKFGGCDGFANYKMRMRVTGATIYPTTTAQGVLIKDVAEAVLNRITGKEDVVRSTLFGTKAKNNLLLKGLHVRGYQFPEKPLTASLDQWWAGTNPLLNLGLGYETEGDADKIRIEKKEYFYNPEMSITLDGIGNLVRTYDHDKFYKEIQVGYIKWSAESTSGIDDVQTKVKYSMRFSKTGKPLSIQSTFYAAGLGIEQTRRNRRQIGKDWKLDEDLMVIAVDEYDGSIPGFPAAFFVEQGNLFADVTGIANAASRYNLRHTPATLMKRWQNIIQAGVQQYNGDKIKFNSGEGNFKDVVTRALDDYEFPSAVIADGVDIVVDVVTEIPLYFPALYELKQHSIEFDQYDLIRTNREKCIGLSKTNANHKPFVIMDMQWSPQHSKADFVLMARYLNDTFDL